MPLALSPPSSVVPYKFPSRPCTSGAWEKEPLMLSKLARVVKVCAREEIVIAAQNRAVKQAVFDLLMDFTI